MAYDEFNGYLFVADASAGQVWRVEQVKPPFLASTTTTATTTTTANAADSATTVSADTLNTNATQVNLSTTLAEEGEEAATTTTTTTVPIMAVIAVNAHVRLSGVAVMPPRANDTKVCFILSQFFLFVHHHISPRYFFEFTFILVFCSSSS